MECCCQLSSLVAEIFSNTVELLQLLLLAIYNKQIFFNKQNILCLCDFCIYVKYMF